jgi:hypothetical protein
MGEGEQAEFFKKRTTPHASDSSPMPFAVPRPPTGRARTLLDAAADLYRDADLPAGQPRVLAGLAWWTLGAGQPDAAISYAADAVNVAGTTRDSESQVLADSDLAAAKSIAEPTPHHTDTSSRSCNDGPWVRRIAPALTRQI